jgi:uncharacterized protein YdhG (YjbR/CyaY superfamily)
MQSSAKTVDDYLAALPAKQRGVLEELRQLIRSAAPEAEEVISYGIPLYNYHGDLVGFGAFKRHLSLFATSSTVRERFAKELEPYEVKHTTIHFSPEKPLPSALVRKIVKLRIAENEGRAAD